MDTLSPPNFVHTSRSVHMKLIPALRTVLKSRKCSRLLDHKGDWVVEPSEVIIFVSENVVESSFAGIHIGRHNSGETCWGTPERAAHRLSLSSLSGSNRAFSALATQRQSGEKNLSDWRWSARPGATSYPVEVD